MCCSLWSCWAGAGGSLAAGWALISSFLSLSLSLSLSPSLPLSLSPPLSLSLPPSLSLSLPLSQRGHAARFRNSHCRIGASREYRREHQPGLSLGARTAPQLALGIQESRDQDHSLQIIYGGLNMVEDIRCTTVLLPTGPSAAGRSNLYRESVTSPPNGSSRAVSGRWSVV